MKNFTSILEAKNLRVVRAGTTLLDVPELTINDGEVLSLIGPNGAGKTTLLQTLCYLLKPFEGEIFFRGHKVGGEYPIYGYRRKLAMVFQEPLLFDSTVFKNVASGLEFRGVKRSEVESIVTENLKRFGIDHIGNRSARTLSGGEAQRTSLARAFAIKPELLFLDEPFAALDPPTRESVIRDLGQALRKSKTTTIFATHDRMDALHLSNRIAIMNEGRILQIGSPADILNHPVSEFVASFIGLETVLNGMVTARQKGSFIASVAGHKIEAIGDFNVGDKVILCVRPENIVISHDSVRGSTSERNVFSGMILKIIPLGPFQKIQLDCGFPLTAYITNDSRESLSLQEGKEITVSFKATAVYVIGSSAPDIKPSSLNAFNEGE
jgi:tungstate transport system ATP-binding protein